MIKKKWKYRDSSGRRLCSRCRTLISLPKLSDDEFDRLRMCRCFEEEKGDNKNG